MAGGWGTREAAAVELDWVADADQARLDQEPLRARALVWVCLGVILLLVGWAGVTELDEVTRGQARVIPSSQTQVVQSVDGGIVEEVLVREGEEVEAGQLLLRIDPTRFVSSLRESEAERLSLDAKAARLSALIQGLPLLLPPDLVEQAPAIAAHTRRLYESSREELDTQLSIAREQLAQREQELREARSRRRQAQEALASVSEELRVTRPMVQSGAVSRVDILRLERDASRFRGERDQADAQISRLERAIEEARQKIEEVELNARNEWSRELADTMGRLAGLEEGSLALEDKVRHAEVRSPVRGTVVRVRVNTRGAVVQPGREVVDILPLDDALVLETRIRPQDIAFLRPGQEAKVKFGAYDFALYGAMDGVVEHISADTITDEQGDTYYLARVRTEQVSLGENLPIIPGMRAEIDILTGQRTLLQYLLKPITRAKENAFTER